MKITFHRLMKTLNYTDRHNDYLSYVALNCPAFRTFSRVNQGTCDLRGPSHDTDHGLDKGNIYDMLRIYTV